MVIDIPCAFTGLLACFSVCVILLLVQSGEGRMIGQGILICGF